MGLGANVYYVIGLKNISSAAIENPYTVNQQMLICTNLGFDKESGEHLAQGFVVQGDQSSASCLHEAETQEDAVSFIKDEYDVFEMDIPKTDSVDTAGFWKTVTARYGVRDLSKLEYATFDFSPQQFGGNPYQPVSIEKGCEVLIVSDEKGYLLSEYMKAAIGGLSGDVDNPSKADIEMGIGALEKLGFSFERHVSGKWKVEITVGKEPILV